MLQWVAHAPADGPTSMHMQVKLIGLSGLFKQQENNPKKLGDICGRSGGSWVERGRYDLNTLYFKYETAE